MDAKVGDWVVTPRHGKPVEIQALWIRALEVGEMLARRFGEEGYAEQCREDCIKARASFGNRYWYDAGGYLYDVIDGPEGDDASLRPNQLYALSLADDLVSQQLLTPVGLRTLSPDDPRYCGRYEGSVGERDGAYHQGTAWPFLLGAFMTAWIKVYGTSKAARQHARRFLDGIEAHLNDACLGQVSEIFDGDAPHNARGCFAQAWSVAEPLRVLIEDLGIQANVPKIVRKQVPAPRRKKSIARTTQSNKGKNTARRRRHT
jgi:glycogen debranching enzyme